MFELIGRLTTKHYKSIIFLWILILIGSFIYSPKLSDELLSSGLEAVDSESSIVKNKISKEYNNQYKYEISIVTKENKEISSNDNTIDVIKGLINENKYVEEVTVSDIKEGKIITVAMNSNGNAFVAELRQKIDNENKLNGIDIMVTGGPAISYDIGETSKSNVAMVEKIGIPIVFILLLLVFRSVIAAIIPIITGMFSIIISSGILYFISLHIELSPLLNNIVTMLGLGIAIDYALFIIRRFRNELVEGIEKIEAVQKAVLTSGKSVFYAGLTVALTLLSLLIPNGLITDSVAIGGFVVVMVSILMSLTFLPAILMLLGKRINMLQLPFLSRNRNASKSSFWDKLIGSLFKKPILFLAVGLIISIIFVPLSSKITMHLPVGAYQELPEEIESRKGMELLVDEFGVGTIFPIQILIEHKDKSVYNEEFLDSINTITSKIKAMDNVQEVKSLTNWNPKFQNIDQYLLFYSQKDGVLNEQLEKELNRIVSKDEHSTILYVIPETPPYTEASRVLVDNIREELPKTLTSEYNFGVTGETAIGMDIDTQIIESIPLVICVIFLITFLILCLAFKSIILPIKAIVLNAIVTASSLGFIVYMFQYGNLPGAEPSPINVNTPLILFALLFGLSIDYEVIIVTRIKEFFDESKDLQTSIQQGFLSTVGMINGAASIMIVVFGVFIFAQFQIIKELGVGLAYAILLDVIIVRTILVPTTMILFGKLNWWLPRFRKVK